MFDTENIQQSDNDDQVIVYHKIKATASAFRRTSSPDHFISHHLAE